MDRRYASLVFLLHPNRGNPRTLYIRRTLFYVFAVALAIGLPASLWGAFELGQTWHQRNNVKLERERDKLAAEKRELADRVTQLRRRVAELESSRSIRAGEVGELRQLLEELQGRVNELQREVGFYRSILDPEKAQRDPGVEDLRLKSLDGSGKHYAYRFKLVQGVSKKDPVTGYARVAVTFLSVDGEEKTLYFPEGARHRRRGMDVEFRYFQDFKGRIELPEDAEPIRITVQLYARHNLGELLSKEHAWEPLLHAQGEEENDAEQEA